MKYLLSLLLSLNGFFVSAQAYKNLVAIDTVDVTYSIYQLFSDVQIEQEPKELIIKFAPISQTKFEAHKKQYGLKVDTVNKPIFNSEKLFSIQASDTIFKFSSITGRLHYYGGFYEQLNCHLVSVAGQGICEMFLIDQETAIGMPLPAFYDGSCNPPIFSPDNRFFMTYGTCPEGKGCFNYYENITTISIFKIPDSKSITELKSFRFIGLNDWAIEEIFWIENDMIVLKVFDQIAFDDKGQDYMQNTKFITGKIVW